MEGLLRSRVPEDVMAARTLPNGSVIWRIIAVSAELSAHSSGRSGTCRLVVQHHLVTVAESSQRRARSRLWRFQRENWVRQGWT